ncbi:MAM domain-containing glycosylphosphatidylinositol anchor protein 1-like [Limanda limanda]|uniref:MAM domain-containing glycosylphosphatidylinositol anchor protein 1-like n=1 Tax=Limanda limanda TaxID=27771 RepID=UPI0029C68769|nr:MAM domain-containing glycosylphosphatidylinositol anchor protein 1-like [Limanda limanda]
MFASARPITLLLLHLLGSVTSLSIRTAAPPIPSQVSRPSPVQSFPSSVSVSPSIPPSISSGEATTTAGCPLTTSPSTVVVRFADTFTVNCSVPVMGFPLLGWEVKERELMPIPESTTDRFLVWSVDRMTEWSIEPSCYALSEQGGQCQIHLPVIVYKPPDFVSISVAYHSGPMLEGRGYTLQCEAQGVAPVGRLAVTFYKGPSALSQLRSINPEKKPVTKVFTLDIIPSKEDNGAEYWCEAKLELGPDGPQHPPVVTSQKLNATILFGPNLVCPTKLQVREGESLSCEVRGNPRPSVTWFRDGQEVALPAHSTREHAGKYTAWTIGHLGEKNFTVEVEVLGGRGTTNILNGYFLLGVVLIQMITWL